MVRLGLPAVLAASLLATSAQAAVLFSENFDDDNGGVTALNFNGFDQFSVSNGTVDLVHNGDGFGLDCNTNAGPDGCVDLDGSTGDAGDLTSDSIAFAVGDYTLSFDLSGNQRGGATDTVTINLTVGGLVSDVIVLAATAPWDTYTYNFSVAAPTNSSIVFSHAGGDNIGILLDNVLVESRAVPEPGALALLGFGALALGLARRRRG